MKKNVIILSFISSLVSCSYNNDSNHNYGVILSGIKNNESVEAIGIIQSEKRLTEKELQLIVKDCSKDSNFDYELGWGKLNKSLINKGYVKTKPILTKLIILPTAMYKDSWQARSGMFYFGKFKQSDSIFMKK